MIRYIYLAGPDVFRPTAKALGAAKKKLCSEFGYSGLFPLDNELNLEHLAPFNAGIEIYHANIALMNQADCIIANMTPFRGAGMDQGTAFEMGYMAAQQNLCGVIRCQRKITQSVSISHSAGRMNTVRWLSNLI